MSWNKQDQDAILQGVRAKHPNLPEDDYSYWEIGEKNVVYYEYEEEAEWSVPVISEPIEQFL